MNPRKPSSAPAATANRGVRGDRPGAVPVPARPSLLQQLDLLADGIEKFKIEFERFLAGATVIPPDEAKARLVRELRELRNANLRASADQFRLASLEARFNSYSELFNRRLRDREEGRGPRAVRAIAAAPERRLDALSGVVVSDRLEAEAVNALYQTLTRQALEAAAAGAAPAMGLDTFRGYLSQQIESIRLKTGCEAVQFRIATEDGKLKLKAKPVSK
ncbi:MAG: MXAN_5187 C-terminal domain-containing protein [Thermoanaerobaculia bacterium]